MTWPKKNREIQNAICDSTRWNGFPFRHGDIVIDTCAKTGTTWIQQIVGQLIFGSVEGVISASHNSPWVDMQLPFPQVPPDRSRQSSSRSEWRPGLYFGRRLRFNDWPPTGGAKSDIN